MVKLCLLIFFLGGMKVKCIYIHKFGMFLVASIKSMMKTYDFLSCNPLTYSICCKYT